jgi:hypothetical protein
VVIINNKNVNEVIMSKFLKGICYSAFPHGYDPSTANNTCIFFGSDIAQHNMEPLWGDFFSPIDGPDADKVFVGRDDLKNLKDLGVNLIRLYDWDPRNNHLPFLDYCHFLGLKVLVPVSNYNLGAFGVPPDMDNSIRGLIRSFNNSEGTNYHSAIYAVIIGSELDLPSDMPKGYLAKYTNRYVELEKEFGFSDNILIGHPVSFATHGDKYPCFKFWDELLPELDSKITNRLILCPHTYNEASYLFDDAEGSGKGWFEVAYDKYKLPILICEIGCSRMIRTDYLQVIEDQITRSLAYDHNNLLGICYFQYCDKVWMSGTTEGSFGAVTNSDQVTAVVHYGPKDFTHWVGVPCDNNSLNIQILANNPSLDIIKGAYL